MKYFLAGENQTLSIYQSINQSLNNKINPKEKSWSAYAYIGLVHCINLIFNPLTHPKISGQRSPIRRLDRSLIQLLVVLQEFVFFHPIFCVLNTIFLPFIVDFLDIQLSQLRSTTDHCVEVDSLLNESYHYHYKTSPRVLVIFCRVLR